MLGKKFLGVVVSAALLANPAIAGSPTVAVASEAKGATVKGLEVRTGDTIFSGDIVNVAQNGWAKITLLDRSLIRLSGKTTARLTKNENTLHVEVGSGELAFHVPADGSLNAVLADATVRRIGKGPAAGVVMFRSPNSAVIASRKGHLSVTSAHDGNTVILKEGEGVEVSLAPAPSAAAPPPPVAALTGAQIAILGVAVAAISIGVGAALSSAEPNVQDVGAIVSPIRP